MELIYVKKFNLIFLENVKGLFSNDGGRTFTRVLNKLSKKYKFVEWATINLLALGIPQNRPRIVIIAHSFKSLVLHQEGFNLNNSSEMSLFGRKNSIGVDIDKLLNKKLDHSEDGYIYNGKYNKLEKSNQGKEKFHNFSLAKFIFGDELGFKVRSGRFWGRTGKTTFYTSENNFSHLIGTSMGGAPTFSFNPKYLNENIQSKVDKVSNWSSEHSKSFVFRLKPEFALKFFGPLSDFFYDNIKESKLPLVKKYKMIGNMFAPDQASHFIKAIIENQK